MIFLFLVQTMFSINAHRCSWIDGTTAPLECVEVCKDAGVETELVDNIQYLPDECKTICYGEHAITTNVQNGQEQDIKINSQIQRQEQQTQKIQNQVEQSDENRERTQTQEQEHARILENQNNNSQGYDELPAQVVRIHNRGVYVNSHDPNVLKIEDEEGTNAQVERVEIKNGKVYIEDLELGCSPSEIKEKTRGTLLRLRITREKSELVYEATTNRNAKIMGIFDVEYKVTSRYNAQNGELVSSNKPIWAIFAFE